MAMNFREPWKKSWQVMAVITQLRNVFESVLKKLVLLLVGILRQQIIFFTSSSSLKFKYLAYTIFIGTFPEGTACS